MMLILCVIMGATIAAMSMGAALALSTLTLERSMRKKLSRARELLEELLEDFEDDEELCDPIEQALDSMHNAIEVAKGRVRDPL